MNCLIIHPQYEFLSKEIERLKNDVVTIRTRIDYINNVDKPYYEGLYLSNFGELEQEINKKYYQYCLLKRKLEMIQVALNRGLTPDMNSIDTILEAQAEEYNSLLQQKAEEIKNATEKKFTSCDAESFEQKKSLYKKIVLALHPDVNPNTSEKDCVLLQEALEAFSSNDIATLDAMYAVLEVSGKIKSESCSGSMDDLQKQCDSLCKTAYELASKLKKINESFPMNQITLLSDEIFIQEKKELLQKQNEEYENLLNSYIKKLAPYEI